MTMITWLWILYLAVGIGMTLYLLVQVRRNWRKLDTRVQEFKEEQAENQGPPPNPYQALAELYAEDERKNRESRRKKRV